MNTKINNLLNDLNSLKEKHKNDLSTLNNTLQDACEEYFKTNEDVRKIVDLQNQKPNGYQFNIFGEVEAWYRVKVDLDQFKDVKEYLKIYIQDYTCGILDFENDALLIPQGPEEIIINDEGDIFLGNKLIIEADAYENEETRNELIEQYMEKTGYFPGVFRTDYYGNIYQVNTQVNQK